MTIRIIGIQILEVLVFRNIETRTGFLDPGKVTVTDNLRTRIVSTQTVEQGEERTLLGWCPGVSRFAFLVQSALIADPDTVLVVVTGMGSRYSLGTGDMQLSVLGDVVVVTDTVETSCPVARLQCLHWEITVAACSTAVDHDQINLSHFQSFNFSVLPFLSHHAALHKESTECSGKDCDDEIHDLV